jgi:hypothetical protein
VRPWRDVRVIAGVLLVLSSAVLGGLLLAAADHTEGYWAVSRDVRAGDAVRREDFTAVRAQVPAPTGASLLRTDRALPGRLSELRWSTDARAGTLVTASALASRRGVVELPFSVPTAGLPGDLRRGDRVDVWSVPDESPARRLLSGVRVVSRTSATGITGGPGVTLVVDAGGRTIDSKLMSALSRGRITVVRVS